MVVRVLEGSPARDLHGDDDELSWLIRMCAFIPKSYMFVAAPAMGQRIFVNTLILMVSEGLDV